MTLLEVLYKLIKLVPNDSEEITVIDGGCNVGNYALQILNTMPDSKVIAFEPDPDSCAEARNKIADGPRFKLVEAALGSKKEKSEFFRGPFSVTNSLLPRPDGEEKQYFPKEATLEGGTFVDVVTLDEECAQNDINTIDLLKLDLQGGELEALKGAKSLLESGSIKVIVTESVFIKKYKDQPLLWELWQYLEQFGYSLYSLAEVKIGSYSAQEQTLRNLQWNQSDTIFISESVRKVLDAND